MRFEILMARFKLVSWAPYTPPIANYNYITVLHLDLQERYLGAALDHDENYCTKVHSESITP